MVCLSLFLSLFLSLSVSAVFLIYPPLTIVDLISFDDCDDMNDASPVHDPWWRPEAFACLLSLFGSFRCSLLCNILRFSMRIEISPRARKKIKKISRRKRKEAKLKSINSTYLFLLDLTICISNNL